MSAWPLHLLRHGAPDQPGLLMGHTDGAPTASGITACLAQAARLSVEVIVTSDLARARQAADAIGLHRHLPVRVDPRWRELDFGDWDGLAVSAIDAQAFARFHADPDRHPPPCGERWSALVNRVAAALADLEPRPTLVLTHGGAMRAALAHLCGFAQPQLWAIDLPCAARLSLNIWPGPAPVGQMTGLRA
ncbi:MAG: histidine phosphatase family protein [bacterium]|nr:histidine phosphatase family protein [bacterium]